MKCVRDLLVKLVTELGFELVNLSGKPTKLMLWFKLSWAHQYKNPH